MLVMGKDGNIREWVGTCTDFSELFESAKQIRASEARYRRLFESAKDGILILDADTGKVVDANPFLLELLGYSFDALCGKYIWDFGVFKDIAASRDAFKTLQDKEYIRYDDLPLETLDGRSIAVEFVSNVYLVEHCKVIQCTIRDISEQKKLEQQFRQAQKMEAIGTLAGGIAHDFNNILTAIVGYGYMAQLNMGPDDPQQENIRHMLEGADRAAHLTRDLRTFSRKQVSEKSPVDLNEIVGIVEKFLVRIIGEDIVCKVILHGEPIVVYADPHQLEQVLMNLATNARDAMQGGGNLTISSETITLGNDFVRIHGYGKPGMYALLTVSDTGSGMDEDTCKKIFEPFFTTKEVGKGTGLGLAVTYGIIKQHEGFINVYSEPGIGTTFKIYLPLITSEVREAEVAQKREILSKGTETILLVEDDASTRELISIILNNEGYTVIEAVDGKDAVKKFVENRETIQLLLSDLIMPRMNGKEAYDEMKAWRPELKAVFVSGYAPDDIRQKMSLDSGAALISKPITPYTLLKKVRSLLDEGDKLG
jgi:PAS domain S-box-containing protein